MEFEFFLKGAIIGFSIAAPVGPIGILCIRKTLEYGRFSGLFTGLGAAFADMLYGIVAAFGLSFISEFLIAEKFWLQLIGGGFLVYLGGKTFFSKPANFSSHPSHKTLLSDFVSTFFLTLTNPMTILSFIAIFAGLGLTTTSVNYANASWLVFGVLIGSVIWWVILSEGISFFRKKISKKTLIWINRSAGIIIFGFGIAAWSLLFVNPRDAVVEKAKNFIGNGIAKTRNFY